MMKQSELLKHITDDELRKSVVYSQFLFLIIGHVLSVFLLDGLLAWTSLIQLDVKEVVYYGVLPGIGIILIDLLLMYFLPMDYFDDGGINKRVFSNLSIPKIILLTMLIAIAEEVLFRGIIQTTFGFIFASLLFAVVHVRYLKKPVLLASIVLVSFLLGLLYEITENLLVTIVAHFTVDVLSGLLIRFKYRGD
ncbi:CPBP family intramembrane glutamic endopeptidase [Ornithinibacillus bavariensis]|nr:CPBP family intramembrane glutamic endopeptidase [Ornithinibacillus bavariensis]